MAQQETATARISTNGRVVIPKDIRSQLGLNSGDYVIMDVRPVAEGGDD
jgi:AbrB family looped-hinge helix DNA binding protein